MAPENSSYVRIALVSSVFGKEKEKKPGKEYIFETHLCLQTNKRNRGLVLTNMCEKTIKILADNNDNSDQKTRPRAH